MAELLELASRIAGSALPGEEVEAYASWQRGTDVRAYVGDVESLSSAESSGIGIRVVKGGRQGFAYVGTLDERLAREALEEARDNAEFASVDENVGLASPDGVEPAELELWDERLEGVTTESKIELALDLEKRTRAGDTRIREVVNADYGDDLRETAIASSTGISAVSRRTSCFLSTHAVAGDRDDTQTGWGYAVGRSIDDLDVEKAANAAVVRATRMIGATKPKSQSVVVVLDREITASLLGIIASTLSGEEVAKGRSLFEDKLGEQVAASFVNIVDDPTNPLAYGSVQFDAEGLACRRNSLIDRGMLVGYLYDSYSARLAKAASTASAVRAGFKSTPSVGARALALQPGSLDQAGVLRAVGEGLFVQSISGVHSGVNPVSGDFSVGAVGLMISGGELAEPVQEMTIASTIQAMLANLVIIGGDVEWLPGNAAGETIAIAEVALSGS